MVAHEGIVGGWKFNHKITAPGVRWLSRAAVSPVSSTMSCKVRFALRHQLASGLLQPDASYNWLDAFLQCQDVAHVQVWTLNC